MFPLHIALEKRSKLMTQAFNRSHRLKFFYFQKHEGNR